MSITERLNKLIIAEFVPPSNLVKLQLRVLSLRFSVSYYNCVYIMTLEVTNINSSIALLYEIN